MKTFLYNCFCIFVITYPIYFWGYKIPKLNDKIVKTF